MLLDIFCMGSQFKKIRDTAAMTRMNAVQLVQCKKIFRKNPDLYTHTHVHVYSIYPTALYRYIPTFSGITDQNPTELAIALHKRIFAR
jgi:hypothetical protein